MLKGAERLRGSMSVVLMTLMPPTARADAGIGPHLLTPNGGASPTGLIGSSCLLDLEVVR
jgi:hypothetical protein